MSRHKISGLAAGSDLQGEELVETVQNGQNVQTTAQDIADLAGYPIDIKVVSAATYVVLEEDNNVMIHYTNAVGVAITLPNGLSDSHITQHVKKGMGNLTFSAAGTLESSGTILATQYNAALAIHEGSNVWGLYGNLT